MYCNAKQLLNIQVKETSNSLDIAFIHDIVPYHLYDNDCGKPVALVIY